MKLDQQICSQLYNQLYSDLVKVASVYGIKKVGLRKYFVPEGDNTSRSILIRLCSSLQNSGQMARSIKFNDDKSDNGKIIEQVLCGFDIEEAKKYRSWEEIYDKLKAKGITDNGAEKRKARKQEADKANKKKEKETNWEKYAKGLFDGIIFLTSTPDSGLEKIRELTKKRN